MFFRLLVIALLSSFSLYAHGVFYDVNEGGISIRISSANNLSISDAKVKVYAPGGSLPYAKGVTDVNGNFAFVPDSKGKWLVKVSVSSDHGNHDKEFNIDITDKFKIKDFDKPPLERYLGIFSAIGIIFGIFGVLSLFRKK